MFAQLLERKLYIVRQCIDQLIDVNSVKCTMA